MAGLPTIPYRSARRSGPVRRGLVVVLGVSACAVATFAILLPVPSLLSLGGNPPGTSMRPMREVGMTVIGAAVGVVFALPLAIGCLLYSRRWRPGLFLGVVACLLVMVSIFAGKMYFDHLVSSRGYILEP